MAEPITICDEVFLDERHPIPAAYYPARVAKQGRKRGFPWIDGCVCGLSNDWNRGGGRLSPPSIPWYAG